MQTIVSFVEKPIKKYHFLEILVNLVEKAGKNHRRIGQIDATRTLIGGGADVNAGINNDTAGTGSYEPASSGHTAPLALAIVNAHFQLGQVLLEAGADPNIPDQRGSGLHALAWVRRPGSGRPPIPTGNLSSLDFARSMLERGAEPNRQITWNEIPFEVDLGIVKPPPNISVGRNFISFVGATPFYLAAKHADVEYMQLLLEHGADPLTPSDQGVTPLMAAAGVGFWDGGARHRRCLRQRRLAGADEPDRAAHRALDQARRGFSARDGRPIA